MRRSKALRASHAGFTLVELMVATFVLAILLGIGIPTFSQTIRNSRATAQSNDMIASLTYARSEATKRGLPVTICAADAARTGCAGPAVNNWANGWLVFTDAGGAAGVVDAGAGDVILKTTSRLANDVQITTNNLGFLRFSRTGVPTNTGGAAAGATVLSLGVQHNHCSGTNRRVIGVLRTGRPNLSKVACT